jgi:ABC-type multidrug transport system fused ATPase/permease subunit
MEGSFGILHYLRKYTRSIMLSIGSNIFLSFFTVVSIPIIIPFFQILFDRKPNLANASGPEKWLHGYFDQLVNTQGKEAALITVCLAIVGVFFLKNIFRYLALYFITPVRNGIVRDLRMDMFDKFLLLPISYFTEERKGDLMSRVTIDVQEVEWSILNTIEAIFKAPIILIGCLIFMITISLKLTLFVVVLLVITALIIGSIGRSLRSTSATAQTKLGELSSILEESLSGMRIIKAFNGEEKAKSKFNTESQSYYKTINAILFRRDLAAPLSEFLGIAIVAILLWYGTLLVLKNELTPETFFAFVFAFYQVIEPAKNLSQALYNIEKGRSAMERINEVLSLHVTNHNRPDALVKNKLESKIEFKDVWFQYPSAQDFALKGFNLTINKGESVALVGPSGGGKSTVADLLIRFQECSKGEILMDGKNILSLDLIAYRDLFGVVTQEAILFNDSIAENITFGKPKDITKLNEAITTAHLQSVIDDLPDNVDHFIGDRGNKLSGGQKQRLTIARAMYKNPAILILDEATSSLDSESEKIVQSSIENIMKDRTSIIIAHRLSTIINADKIVVVKDGLIHDVGSHDALMLSSPIYQNLVANQIV